MEMHENLPRSVWALNPIILMHILIFYYYYLKKELKNCKKKTKIKEFSFLDPPFFIQEPSFIHGGDKRLKIFQMNKTKINMHKLRDQNIT